MVKFLLFLAMLALQANAKTLSVQIPMAPVVLDWNTQSTLVEAPVILNTQEGLFRYSPTGELTPAIAEKVEKSKDFKTYTFKIRKNAKWSDGRPVYAQDFVNAWSRAISPQSTSIYTYYFFNIVNAKQFNQKKIESLDQVGFSALNDSTLEVKLIQADQNWEEHTAFWSFFPVRKDLIEKFGTNWWRAGVVTSTGPFVMSTSESDKKITLTRNPYYTNYDLKRAGIKSVTQVELNFSSDFEKNLENFHQGKLQVISYIPFQKLDLVKSKKLTAIPLLRIYAFGLNTERYPMNNKNFRAGLLRAIDRSKLIPKFAVHLKPVNSLIASPLLGSSHSSFLNFNVNEAKELIKKSGVLVNSKLKIQIITGTQEPSISIAKEIQSQLRKNLGLNIEVNAVESKEYNTFMDLGEYKGFLITWTAKVKNSVDFLLPYSGYALNNRAHYFSEKFDQLIANVMVAKSKKEQEKNLILAQKYMIQDESVLIPICTEELKALIDPSVSGVTFNHLGVPQFLNAQIKH